MTYALGVDLGTTALAAATFANGQAHVVHLGGENRMVVPSVAFIDGADRAKWLVGMSAVGSAAMDPSRAIRYPKRDLGRETPFVVGGVSAMPEEILTRQLTTVVDTVVRQRGEDPAHLTVTHPAQWGDFKLGLLRHVAEDAGFPEAGLLAEPDAAAVYFAAQHLVPADSSMVVYDLGGGTLDVSLLRKTADRFELVGEPFGRPDIGGLDFDVALQDLVRDAAGAAWPELDRDDPALDRFELQVVQAKELLSVDLSVDIEIPGTDDRPPPVRINRDDYERAVQPLIDETMDLVEELLAVHQVASSSLYGVLLAGAASRTPLVAGAIQKRLGTVPLLAGDPKLCVCLGAAITAGAVTDTVATQEVRPIPASDVTIALDLEAQGLAGSSDVPAMDVAPVSRFRAQQAPDRTKFQTLELEEHDTSEELARAPEPDRKLAIALAALIVVVLVGAIVLAAVLG